MNEMINVKGILKSLVFSIAATILCLFILSVVCYFSNLSDKMTSILVFALTVICVFLGGLFASKTAPKSGFLHGGLVGFGYFLLLFLCSILANKGFAVSAHTLSMGIGCVGAGILGGILGINSKTVNC